MSGLDIVVLVRDTGSDSPAARAASMLAQRLPAYLYGLHVAPLGAVAFSTPETVVFQVNEADRLYDEAKAKRGWWH